MKELGYIEVKLEPIIGYADKEGRRTRIAATAKLNKLFEQDFNSDYFPLFQHSEDEELIRLKNDNKKLIEYTDNGFTTSAREKIEIINKNLQSHWYDLWITDAELKDLGNRLRNKSGHEIHNDEDEQSTVIDFTTRRLYRVFNNSSFEHGGRFYGGWWQQIPKEMRKFITINEKHTVELDFANLHPWMLYARKGIQKDLQKYDAYKVSNRIDRKYSKLAFNMLINAKRRPNPPASFNELDTGISWQEILNTVIEFHTDIKEFFASGEGVKLQNKDAQIAEGVLLHFAKMNYPCLPLHDSFIIHHALKEELQDIMLLEFQKVYGVEIKIEQKEELNLYEDGYITDAVEDVNPETLFTDNKGYNGYESRLIQWNNYKGTLTDI